MSRFYIDRKSYTAQDFGYNYWRSYNQGQTHLKLPDDIEDFYSTCDPQDIIELVRYIDTDNEEDDEKEYAYLLDGAYTTYGDPLTQKPMTENELFEYWRESIADYRHDQAEDIINGGYYDAAVELMDDEIREELHAELSPCSDLEFLEAYMKRHYEKYGVEFVI